MNFKYLFLLILISACGVKGDPVSPAGQNPPSVLDNYQDVQVDQSLQETKKR